MLEYVNIPNIITFVAGALLTLGAIYFRDWLGKQQKNIERSQRQLAVYSGIFPVRNYIIDKINKFEQNPEDFSPLKELEYAIPQIVLNIIQLGEFVFLN